MFSHMVFVYLYEWQLTYFCCPRFCWANPIASSTYIYIYKIDLCSRASLTINSWIQLDGSIAVYLHSYLSDRWHACHIDCRPPGSQNGTPNLISFGLLKLQTLSKHDCTWSHPAVFISLCRRNLVYPGFCWQGFFQDLVVEASVYMHFLNLCGSLIRWVSLTHMLRVCLEHLPTYLWSIYAKCRQFQSHSTRFWDTMTPELDFEDFIFSHSLCKNCICILFWVVDSLILYYPRWDDHPILWKPCFCLMASTNQRPEGVLTRSRRDSQGDAFLRLHRSGFHEGDVWRPFSGGDMVMVIGVGLDVLGILKVRRVS